MHSRIGSSRMNTSMMGRGTIKGSKQKYGTPEKKQRQSFTKHYKKMTEFNPSQFMVAECSLRDIQIYKQVFDFLDEDHDGMLTPLDLRKTIRQFGGYNPGKQFVYVSMSVFDTDDGGQINFRQFVKIMTQKPYQSDTTQDLTKVFEQIDQDNKGYIDEDDLRRLAETMKEDVTLAEIRQTISYADPNGQGVIRKQKFIQFSKNKKLIW